jgi:hypothetical protein
VVVKTWGTPREEPELLNHVDLVARLGIADLEKGTAVAGAGFQHFQFVAGSSGGPDCKGGPRQHGEGCCCRG